MNYVQQKMKRRAGIIGMVCLLAAALSSCVKDHSDDIVTTPSAALSIVNAYPSSTALDLNLDNNHVNTSPLAYNTGLDYFAVYTGKRTAIFYNTGTTNVVKSDTMTFKADNYYTLYIANTAHPDYLLTRDTLTRPATNMATVRLVNVSPDAPALDLVISGGATVVTKKTYLTYSSFIPVTAGTSITFQIRQNGTSNVLATVAAVTLRAGSVYTVWVHGLVAGTGTTALGADVQNNAYYY